jgi:GAF domain-containing protein
MHLEASTAVSQAAVSILDPQKLMQTTVDLIRERFKYYHVSFFLLDEAGEWAVVRASTGEIGRKMVAKPHRLLVGGESMVGWVCQHRKPRIALDVGADAVHFDNPLLPHTRSEITLPLRVGDRLLGALDVQSVEENAFGNDDLRALQGMADLVAITLENARLFATTRKGTRHQRIVASISERVQQAVGVDETLALSLQELGETFDLARATICLGTKVELQAFDAGSSDVLDREPSPQDTE